jgi:pathogenesis-related protein 1
MTDLHNIVRASYESPPLVWDITLEEEAAIWALDLADTGCIASSSNDPLYGEIVFDSIAPLTEEDVFDLWVDEENDYDPIDHICAPNASCDRFTQMMWFETERLGCAQAICDRDRGEIWVCKYDPPGNETGVNPF